MPRTDARPAAAAEPEAGAARPAPRSWLLWALLLALLTAAVYAPSLPGEFIWDDDDYVTENIHLRSTQGLRDIWVPGSTPQYYPVTFSSFWLEYSLWGLNPLGYHLVNLLIHIATGLLLWRFFARLGVPVAFFAAAAFLLHPQHVETVAWVMERKNTLSAFFYVLAANAFLTFELRREDEQPGARSAYAWSFTWFVLALLCKTIICTLPAALILLRLYRRRPVNARSLVPLLPFFAIGLWLARMTAQLEHGQVGASGEDFAFSLVERVLIASRALLFYATKLLVPYPLLFQYPRWEIDSGDPLGYWAPLAVLALGAVLLVLWRAGRRGPFLAAALFAGSLTPALGFISFYPMKFSFVADHFNYLPSIGLLLLVAGGVRHLVRERLGPESEPALRRMAAVALAALALGTAAQSYHFRSARSIYEHTLDHHPGAFLASGTLAKLVLDDAQAQAAAGDAAAAEAGFNEAAGLYASALAALPDDYDLLFSYALTLRSLGRPSEALPWAVRATEVTPGRQDAWRLSGVLMQQLGQTANAEQAYREALERPSRDLTSYVSAARGLAECLAKQGRLNAALATVDSILATMPPESRTQAGRVLRDHVRSLVPK